MEGIPFFSAILQAVQALAGDKRARTKDVEATLFALSEAYHITHAYLIWRESHRRSPTREWKIADKWYRTSILLKKYDNSLSHRFHMKSRYWREGASWSNRQIDDAKIGLEAVWVETNAMMREKG